MKTRFRWVNHSVYGLRLFFDISYSKKETCTKEDEFFPMEIKLPKPVLKMIAGKKIPKVTRL
ncbi:MAG: hypothetical protein QQN62_06885 [Nitrosopumilus sp.]